MRGAPHVCRACWRRRGGGDESAWAELIGEELRTKVYAAMRWRISDPDAVDEAWQEAAVIAQRHVLDAVGEDGVDRFAAGNFDGWFSRVFSRSADPARRQPPTPRGVPVRQRRPKRHRARVHELVAV